MRHDEIAKREVERVGVARVETRSPICLKGCRVAEIDAGQQRRAIEIEGEGGDEEGDERSTGQAISGRM